MKLAALTLLGLLAVSTSSLAQFSIKGRIIDQENAGVTFANVLLLSPTDSSLVKGAVTDDQGYYTLANVKQGQYMIQSYLIGYAKSYSNVFSLRDNKQLAMRDIVLSEDTEQLEEVVVKAQKPLYEVELGKMVVNVSSSITSSGQSAIDVLEKSPGVTVNRQDNSFALSGKNGVIVLMNGKRSRMPLEAVYQMLSGLNAGDIEKIEIMTVPPAKYDADGDAGFINIVMKSGGNNGTHGTVMLNAGYATGPRLGSSINLSHQRDRLGVYGSYSFGYRGRQVLWDNYRESDAQLESTEAETKSVRDDRRPSHNYTAGLDYSLGERTIVGLLVSGYDNRLHRDAITNSDFRYSSSEDTLIQLDILEKDHWSHIMGNINLQHTFNKGQVITANLDYLEYDNYNRQVYENQYFDQNGGSLELIENRLSKETPIKLWVGKLDYSMDIGEKVKAELGVKGTFSALVNDIVFEEKVNGNWQVGSDFTSYANLTEDVYAAYGSVNVELSSKTNMSAGLRYEHTLTYLSTVTESGLVDRNYGNFFPSIYMSHKINDNNTVQLSYGRRITRPSFNQMAPWVIFHDPYTYFSGNASIFPTFTNSAKAEYSRKSVLFSVQYSHDDNVIMRFQPTLDPETNVMVLVSDNIDTRRTIASNLSFPIALSIWWEMQNNISANWQMIDTQLTDQKMKRSQFGFQANSTQVFMFPADFTVELSGFYVSPVINGYFNWLSRGFVNLGVQKDFGSAGTLRLSCNDIFETGQYRWRTTDDADFYFTGRYKYEKRIFLVSYTYQFGNNKVKKRKRSVGSAEEMRRVDN